MKSVNCVQLVLTQIKLATDNEKNKRMLHFFYNCFQCLIETLSSNIEKQMVFVFICNYGVFFLWGNVEFLKLLEEASVTRSLYDALSMLMVFVFIY